MLIPLAKPVSSIPLEQVQPLELLRNCFQSYPLNQIDEIICLQHILNYKISSTPVLGISLFEDFDRNNNDKQARHSVMWNDTKSFSTKI